MPGFIDNKYFLDVSMFMVEKGFKLFAYVQLSTDEGFHHHVNAPNARDTRLFFHYPNKSLIICLNYHEDDYNWGGEARMEGSWEIRFYHQLVDVETLVRLTYIPFEERMGGGYSDESEVCRRIMFHGLSPTPTHFTWRGGSEMCELYQPERPTAPAVIMADIEPIVDGVLPYLAPLPFDELQVTSFPPYYTFLGCEERFWEKFKASVDSRYLWSLVTRPWGSDGLKR
jgi:hypothetical protein